MPSSHMEVGCPGTWGTGTADPKPSHELRPPEKLKALASSQGLHFETKLTG